MCNMEYQNTSSSSVIMCVVMNLAAHLAVPGNLQATNVSVVPLDNFDMSKK